MSKPLFTPCSLLLLFLLSMLVGCGPGAEPAETVELRSNMRTLAAAYGGYLKSNRGRAPKDEKAFRKWIEKQGDDYLEILSVDAIDDIFVSTRDGEPYVITYGKAKRVVAYEAVGADGTRFVADDLGVVEELDEATFNERVPDAE